MMEKKTAFYSRQGGRKATSAGGGGGKRGGGNGNSNSRGCSMNGRRAKLNGDSVCYKFRPCSLPVNISFYNVYQK